jgi:hypothetical protein
MNDDSPAGLLRGLDGRAGAARLLRRLGFTRPLRRLAPRTGTGRTRSIRRSINGVLAAFVVELRGPLETDGLRATARALRSLDSVRHHVIVAADHDWTRVALACESPAGGLHCCTFDRSAIRHADIEVIAELLPEPGETGTAVALRMMRALDRARVSHRFFRDVVAVRNLVARGWTGLPRTAGADREALALLFLSRLMFLYFLQRRGLLAGDTAYLPRLLREWLSTHRRTSFYRARIRTLFFDVLNRRPERRPAAARSLGPLPYLNGGLFERHRIESAHPGLDLPDDVVQRVVDGLLEKYRFTSTAAAEPSAGDGGSVDPEILGRIFEGLMPGDRRSRTGTFYTPAPLVDHVVDTTLVEHLSVRYGIAPSDVAALCDGNARPAPCAATARVRHALRDMRVLDPACGSGAFLLGALTRIAQLRTRLEPDTESTVETRRDIVARALHGVDLLEDAALLCSLRLWLALVPDRADGELVTPLPNLDRRVRQGDALIDPLDIGAAIAGRPLDTTTPARLRSLIAALEPTGSDYLAAGPESRPALRRRLQHLERDVAKAWLGALEARLAWEARELHARAADRDLFDQPARHSTVASKRLRSVRSRLQELHTFRQELRGLRRLPFFSFRVHFAEARGGFDLVLSNPPWVRSQHWPPTARRLLRERYAVCAEAGWPYAAHLSGQPSAAGAQVDLSLLFLERSIRLLADGGTLGMLLPAKLFRSLYAGGARALLARTMRIARIEDHSLDHRAAFDADAFTAVLVARRSLDDEATTNPDVVVTLRRAGRDPLCFSVPERDLPLRADDSRSPWLLAPPTCRAVLRTMQRAGPSIGEQLAVRRGVMTGANAIMVVRDVDPKLGDIARIRTEGYYRATTARTRRTFSGWVEASAIRPALRGTDVARWCARPARHLLWTPHNDDPSATAPPRLRRFLRRHRGWLRQEQHEPGVLQRLSLMTLGHKVVWSDLATDLRAAAVPSSVRCVTGADVPLVPLNTVYFLATSSMRESLLLAAYLNSLPLRVFARAIAERAKDCHFRFFAWTIAVLPLPCDWRDNDSAEPLLELSETAHRRGGMTDHDAAELDRLVARGFTLDPDGYERLVQFDEWLAASPATEES